MKRTRLRPDRSRIPWWFALLAALLLAACGGSNGWSAASTASDANAAGSPGAYAAESHAQLDSDAASDFADGRVAPSAPPPPPSPPGTDDATQSSDPTSTAGDEPTSTKRRPLLIYTATLTLAVFQAEESLEEVEQLALAAEGYLVKRTNTLITVRVPAEKFREMLELFAKTGDELARDVEAMDVTDQYRDLIIRLRNAEALRDRLETLLGEAKNVEEALAVEAQLQRVAGEIELYKGKLKRMNELIAFSTITVRYEARPVDQVNSEFSLPFPWLGRLGLPNLLELEER